MKKAALFLWIVLGTTILTLVSSPGFAQTNEAQIRALEEQLGAAMKAKDLDRIMSAYSPDESLFVFDVVPPRQYVGAKAYREDFENFLAAYPGAITVELSDLAVVADGKLGFAHYVIRVAGTDKAGKEVDNTYRITDCLRKQKGKWLIVHEHVSVPVDLATGKADLTSKP